MASARRPNITNGTITPIDRAAAPPPHNAEAEKSVLGSMLLAKPSIATAAELLTSEDFYSQANGNIWAVIVDLWSEGHDADVFIVSHRLQEAGLLETCGGGAYLNELGHYTPTAAYSGRIEPLCESIAEHAQRRRLIAAAYEAIITAETGGDTDLASTALIESLTAAPRSQSRLRKAVLQGNAIFNLPDPTWHIEGILQTQSLPIIYGPPKTGKTFFALDLALHIANGLPWRGLKVTQAKVLYVVAEGLIGIRPRANAWLTRNPKCNLDNVTWLAAAPNLYNSKSDVSEVIGIAKDCEAELIFLDTLARVMAGADENSAKDVGILVENLTRIQEATHASTAGVHHTGKDPEKGMRGSSAFRGAYDTGIEVTGDPSIVHARVTDQKNAESGQHWWWRPIKVEGSIWLDPIDEPSQAGPQVEDIMILRQLELIAGPEGIAATAWLKACTDARAVGSESTFFRRRKALEDSGEVEQVKRRYRLTPAGWERLRGMA
jgi:hypothetical protein